MITIFSIPKPFKDPHIINIQTNAVLSWLNLDDEVEVILAGNDLGVVEFCEKFNISNIANVNCNEYGTPLLNSAFALVRKQAKNNLLMYVNADIILTDELLKILNFLPPKEFLIIGQRWDLNIDSLIDYTDKNWQLKLKNEIKFRGVLHPPAGSDFFIFHKNSFQDIPTFAVGRVGWDNWMIESGLSKNMPVIDCSPLLKVIHQNHNYQHKGEIGYKIEDKKNLDYLNKDNHLKTIIDASYFLTIDGLKKKKSVWYFCKYLKKIIHRFVTIIKNYSMIKVLKLLRNLFYLTTKISKKVIEFINAPLFYLGQSECEKFNDCRLLAKVLYNQPPNSDRCLEYPWMFENIKITSGKILDVGSTASNMLYNFLPKEVEINSIDLNSKQIENNSIKFSIGDIRKTNYKNNYFDVISCISTLEHIGISGRYGSDEDPIGDLRAVKEMTRILKPGGTMLITVPYGIRDVLPINKLYNKKRINELFIDFSSIEIGYKKYFKQFNLWLTVNEIEAAKTDMIADLWYAIAFIKVKKK